MKDIAQQEFQIILEQSQIKIGPQIKSKYGNFHHSNLFDDF